MSKHRDHLIEEHFTLHPESRGKIELWPVLDFLENEGELLDDDAFDEVMRQGAVVPYSHASRR